MSIINPLTASTAIARVPSPSISTSEQSGSLSGNYGVFSDDILEISKQGVTKQTTEAQLGETKEFKDIASDVIRVTSTIGKARSKGNLTNEQAMALYQKIATML